jgi:acetyl esterase/lipase
VTVSPPPFETIAYGEHEDTVFDVHRPDGPASGTTVVLLHGGFWREQYRRDLMAPLAPSLLVRGHVVVNLEYRRVGGAGGWPTTFEDVAAGVDALTDVVGVDPERVVTVGHSAGGHLAVWAAARHRLPDDAPGSGPVVRPCHAISQAGVVVLDDAVAAGLGNAAVTDLLGGENAERRAVADPSALLPLGVSVTLVHGEEDDTVPVAQSRTWVTRAEAAGDTARLITRPGDHLAVIQPTHALWADVLDVLDAAC